MINSIIFNILLTIIVFQITTINTAPPPSPQDSLVPLLDGRIVNGVNANIEDFPYQISLRYNGKQRCGGTIIGLKVVLSAAHCFGGDKDPRKYTIRAGSSFRNSGGILRQVERIIVQRKYSDKTMDNDIAILLLSEELEFSKFIRKAVLPFSNENVEDNTPALVSGWGTLSEGGSLPSQLQYVKVNVLSEAICKMAYNGKITETMFCAGYINGGYDSCQGDSGGPLVIKTSCNRFKLIGIVSWGLGCARPGYPGVYANVAVLRKWIDGKLKSLSIVL